jgi:adenylate cyclase
VTEANELSQRLVAILAADVAGYSRLMAEDERATVAALDAARALFRSQIEGNRGRVVDMAGDSILAVFQTATGAVAASLAIQRDLAACDSALPIAQRMRFRIGVHLGDVFEKTDGSVYGDGVNIAARLQLLAEAGGVSVSEAVRDATRGKVPASFVDRGAQHVKNIPHPVRSFAVQASSDATGAASAATKSGLSLPERPSIAVLPFANMSGDPEQDYFADGMVEDLTTALARMGLFFVIARNSSFVYKGRAVDIKQVGRELGVRYVLEGSVRRSGDRVRIAGQLISAETGYHIWADRFEGALEDVFGLQDRITEGIVSAMEPNVRRAEIERARVKSTSNLGAYDLLLRSLPGLLTPGTSRASKDESLSLIRRALEMDPRYALAKALGALACMGRVYEGFGTADDVRAGLRYADEALSDRDDDAMVLSLAGGAIGGLGYRVMGFRVLGFRHDEAIRAVERALQLSPDLLPVQLNAGVVRLLIGEGDTALKHFERVMRFSPLDPSTGAFVTYVGMAHLASGRLEEALAAAQRAIQESPTFVIAHQLYVVALGRLGRVEEAKLAARRLLDLAPGFTVSRFLSVSPIKDAERRNRSADIFRAAGIPK